MSDDPVRSGRRTGGFRSPPEREPLGSGVSLSLVDILFGLVLAQVFVATANGYAEITGAGWAHLTLAGWTIVQSWVGYHNYRLSSDLWRLDFTRLPMLQFGIDIVIVAAYWAMVITAEGIPISPGRGSDSALHASSGRPESVLLASIFLLYFVWDSIEIVLAESPEYAKRAERPGLIRSQTRPRRWWLRVSRWRKHPPEERYACEARPMRLVSGTFFLILLALGAVVWAVDPTSTSCLVVVDALFGLVLYVYRVLHGYASTNAFED